MLIRMKRLQISALILLPFAFPISSLAADPERASSDEKAISPKDDVIRLLDGITLGDCYTWLKDTQREDPRKVFRIDDGMFERSVMHRSNMGDSSMQCRNIVCE